MCKKGKKDKKGNLYTFAQATAASQTDGVHGAMCSWQLWFCASWSRGGEEVRSSEPPSADLQELHEERVLAGLVVPEAHRTAKAVIQPRRQVGSQGEGTA